jgi:hypothetical protein
VRKRNIVSGSTLRQSPICFTTTPDNHLARRMKPNGASERAGAQDEAPVLGLPSLPIDLLPWVLSHLSWRITDLAACARVNTAWKAYAQPLLYERIVL